MVLSLKKPRFAICSSLDLEYPSKSPVSKAQSPAVAWLEGSRACKCTRLEDALKSLREGDWNSGSYLIPSFSSRLPLEVSGMKFPKL